VIGISLANTWRVVHVEGAATTVVEIHQRNTCDATHLLALLEATAKNVTWLR
jgi:hypothetical protein